MLAGRLGLGPDLLDIGQSFHCCGLGIRLPGVEGKGCGVLAGIQLCALQLAQRNRGSAL